MVKNFFLIVMLISIVGVFHNEAKTCVVTKYKPIFQASQIANVADVILTEFGDDVLYKIYSFGIYSRFIPTFVIKQSNIELVSYTDTVICQHYELNDLKFSERAKKAYNSYPYKLFDGYFLNYEPSTFYHQYNRTDKTYKIYITIDGPFMNRWRQWMKYSGKSDISEFSIFIRRDILSCVKNILGEEHEYYKYLLEKYAPLQPYDDWHPQGKNWIKPENE